MPTVVAANSVILLKMNADSHSHGLLPDTEMDGSFHLIEVVEGFDL